MKRAKQIAQQNIVRADRRKRGERQDHHLLPAAFALFGVECAVGPQKTPPNPREGPDQIDKQNRPDALETAKPDEHGGHQEQEHKEQYTGCAEKRRMGLVFIEALSNFFRVEHFLEFAFERPVALLGRLFPNTAENSGEKSCIGFRVSDEEDLASRPDFFIFAVNLLFFVPIQANCLPARDSLSL